MKDIILKPGTFLMDKKNSHTDKIPGTSLENYIVNLLKNNTCCTKALVLTKGAVTQGSGSGRATAVTLNTPTGVITSDATSLSSATSAVFTVTNSFAKADSIITLTASSNHAVILTVESIAAGSFAIRVYNASGGAITTAIKIQYVIL